VPNVSFSAYKLNFFQRFIEAHAVMFSGNAGLKPKDGEMVIASMNPSKLKTM
jgi:dolichyl-phosphate-mannose-protein mannosyltransferase